MGGRFPLSALPFRLFGMYSSYLIVLTFRMVPLYLCNVIHFRFQVTFHVGDSSALMGECRIIRRRYIRTFTLVFQRSAHRMRISRFQLTLRDLRRVGPARQRGVPFHFLRDLKRIKGQSSRASRFIIFLASSGHRRIMTGRQGMRVSMMISLLLDRAYRTMWQHMQLIRYPRRLLHMQRSQFHILGLRGLRSMFLLCSLTSARVFFQCSIQCVSFRLVPILIFYVSRAFRLFQVMEVVVSNHRHPSLIRSLCRRSFIVRVNGSRQPLRHLRTLSCHPFFCDARRNVRRFNVIGRICRPRAYVFLIPYLITPTISRSYSTSRGLSIFMYWGMSHVARFRHQVLLFVRHRRLFFSRTKRVVQITFVWFSVRLCRLFRFLLANGFFGCCTRQSFDLGNGFARLVRF